MPSQRQRRLRNERNWGSANPSPLLVVGTIFLGAALTLALLDSGEEVPKKKPEEGAE